MNTTLKGNLFEEKAYEIIMTALREGQLGILPDKAIGFRKKSYSSKDRDGEIIFDLSIEVWPEGAERYTWLCLIECKNYANRRVEPGDIVKFVGDIDSVAGKNVKGIFISTTKLQKSAYNYAKAKGLMVIYVDEKSQSNIVLYNTKRKSKSLSDAPVYEFDSQINELQEIDNYYDKINGTKDSDSEKIIYNFLSNLLNNNIYWRQPDSLVEGLQHLSQKIIEKITIKIINEFDTSIIRNYDAFPMDAFIPYFMNKYGVKINTNEVLPFVNGKKLNGYYNRQEKTIYIDSSLFHTPKFNFVLAHEIGHFFLHSHLSMGQLKYDLQKDSQYDKLLGKHALINEKHWIEWQANQFAAALLMPYDCILANLIYYQIKHDINGNRGKIYLDYQTCNKIAYQNIMLLFTEGFKVSLNTLEYRLSDLKILIFGKGASYSRIGSSGYSKSPKTIGQIIGDSFFSQQEQFL